MLWLNIKNCTFSEEKKKKTSHGRFGTKKRDGREKVRED